MSDSLWPHGLQPARLLCPSDFPGKNTGVHCHFLLQGIFPTRDWTCVSCIAGSLLHRKQIHYHWGTREAPTSMLVPQKQKICLVYFITMLCFKNKTKQNKTGTILWHLCISFATEMMSSPYSWIQPDSQQVFFESLFFQSLFLCSAVGKVRSWRICRNKSGEGMEITGRVLHVSETIAQRTNGQ